MKTTLLLVLLCMGGAVNYIALGAEAGIFTLLGGILTFVWNISEDVKRS